MFRLLRLRSLRVTSAAAMAFALFQTAIAFGADAAPQSNDVATVVVVVGAPGEEEYGVKFNEWASRWEKASKAAGAKWTAIGYGKEASTNEAEELRAVLDKEPKFGAAELWIVLLGHGTYDGRDSKFNLRGLDISAADLAKLLEPFQRPTAVIAAFSASAPFLTKLSGKGRVVITSTRSGHEQNFSRFGDYISGAVVDPEADLDKDGQTSLLEAYLIASRRTAEFYETEGRLATEHSLLDDNGDALGTPPDWFRGVRAVKKAKEGAQLDGLRAHQIYLVRNDAERRLSPEVRARRDELELAIAHLRESKATMPEDDYYQKLEVMAVEMARLYEKAAGSPGNEK